MKVLLIYPPYTSLKQCYSSLPALTAFLRQNQVEVAQWDLGIDFIHECTNNAWANRFIGRARSRFKELQEMTELSVAQARQYYELAHTVPYAPYFSNLEKIKSDIKDIKTIETFRGHRKYLEDFPARILKQYFRMVSALYYPEKIDYTDPTQPNYIAPFPSNTMDGLEKNIHANTLFNEVGAEMILKKIEAEKPDLVGISVTFEDQFSSAVQIAYHIKKTHLAIKLILGGALINATCRELKNERLFNYFDLVSIDGGEVPLLSVVKELKNSNEEGREANFENIPNLFHLKNSKVVKNSGKTTYNPGDFPAPDFNGIDFDKYLSPKSEINLPLMLAYGCYWGKCTFCEIDLPYVGSYQPQLAQKVAQKMKQMSDQTGITSFHFVDEACPPKMLRQLSEILIKDNSYYRWYGNVRLEKYFTKEFCRTMRRAGCFKVTAGLESANDRILDLMDKGISMATLETIIENFALAGIYVHTYLIIGFPTETPEEAHNTLNLAKKLIKKKVLHSMAWADFVVAHNSGVSADPKKYGIVGMKPPPEFGVLYSDVQITSGMNVAEIARLQRKFKTETNRAYIEVSSDFAVEDETVPTLSVESVVKSRPYLPSHISFQKLPFSPTGAIKVSGNEKLKAEQSAILINMASNRSQELLENWRYHLLEACNGERKLEDILKDRDFEGVPKDEIDEAIQDLSTGFDLLYL